MRPLFAHDPAVVALAFGSLALWSVIQGAVKRRLSPEGRSAPEWSALWVAVLMLGSLVGSVVIADNHVAPIGGNPWWPVIVGLILMCVGSGFRTWAMVTLGEFFKLTVTIQENHRVVEGGPYRLVRHPSYLGGIVAMVGFGLMEGDWVSVALILLATLAALAVRIRVEERTLLTELGEPYAAYARRTSRLIPGLY
jgi:protein-S-isoprenylcysteine O-methyltransferase Ste14